MSQSLAMRLAQEVITRTVSAKLSNNTISAMIAS